MWGSLFKSTGIELFLPECYTLVYLRILCCYLLDVYLQFQKRSYANLKWFKCGKKGYGLQLLEDISPGQFLIEYVGEVG